MLNSHVYYIMNFKAYIYIQFLVNILYTILDLVNIFF